MQIATAQEAINGNSNDTIITPLRLKQVLSSKNISGGIEAPILLYENDEGSNETITLNDDASSYSYLEFFYRDNSNFYSSTKVYSPNGKIISLQINQPTTDNLYAINIKSVGILVNGTTVTPQAGREINFRADNKTIYNLGSDRLIYITRIIGWK